MKDFYGKLDFPGKWDSSTRSQPYKSLCRTRWRRTLRHQQVLWVFKEIFENMEMRNLSGYSNHGPLDSMGVSGVSPLAMMSMHELHPWMKEKKSSRKNQMQGKKTISMIFFPLIWKIFFENKDLWWEVCIVNKTVVVLVNEWAFKQIILKARLPNPTIRLSD